LYFVQFMLKYEMKTLLLDVHVTIQWGHQLMILKVKWSSHRFLMKVS
jgi:hypothetical protein